MDLDGLSPQTPAQARFGETRRQQLFSLPLRKGLAVLDFRQPLHFRASLPAKGRCPALPGFQVMAPAANQNRVLVRQDQFGLQARWQDDI